jgi:hypothetical protein
LAIEQAIERIRDGSGVVYYPIDLVHPSEVVFNGVPGYEKIAGQLLYHDFEHSAYGSNSFTAAEARENINNYLSGLVKTPVRTLEEMIEWNKNHPEDQAGIGENIDFVEKARVALMTL